MGISHSCRRGLINPACHSTSGLQHPSLVQWHIPNWDMHVINAGGIILYSCIHSAEKVVVAVSVGTASERKNSSLNSIKISSSVSLSRDYKNTKMCTQFSLFYEIELWYYSNYKVSFLNFSSPHFPLFKIFLHILSMFNFQ